MLEYNKQNINEYKLLQEMVKIGVENQLDQITKPSTKKNKRLKTKIKDTK